jgi:hypothetical protein
LENTETSCMLVPIRRVTPLKLKPIAPLVIENITGSQGPLLPGDDSWKKPLQVHICNICMKDDYKAII